MRPTAEEVLKSIIWTFEEQIMPTINDPFAASLSLTVKNLLHHVLLRMSLEGEALAADNMQLSRTLEMVRSFAERLDGDSPAKPAIIEHTRVDDPIAKFVPITTVIDQATALRTKLDAAICVLQDHRAELGVNEDYPEVRKGIRAYLRDQVEREAAWITPAFVGPRR